MNPILRSSLEEEKHQIHHRNLPIRHRMKRKGWALDTLVVVLEEQGLELEMVHNEVD